MRFSATGQESWSLERCINEGLQANLTLQSAQFNVERSLIQQRQWLYAMLPTVNGSINYGYQFGRTIDPTSNSFIEATTNFANGQLQASMTLWDGLRIQKSRQQAKVNTKAAIATWEDARNTIALQIATAYINVLFAEEQAATARSQRELTATQAEQITRLVSAGVRPEVEKQAIAGQLAQNEYQLILSDNAVRQAYLSLYQLMQLPPDKTIQILRPESSIVDKVEMTALSADEVYKRALNTQPGIRAAGLRQDAAALGPAIARSGMYPSLRLFGGLTTAYSNNFLDYSKPDFSNAVSVPGQPQDILINGQLVTITPLQYQGIEFPAISFNNQLDRNFGKNIGVNLIIPIYNNHLNRTAVQQARLTHLQTQNDLEQAKLRLRSEVETAWLTANASRRQYQAAMEAWEAAQSAFEATQKRYDLGAANLVEMTTARTNRDLAQNQQVIARFDYLFRIKVLDFYLGNPLTIN